MGSPLPVTYAGVSGGQSATEIKNIFQNVLNKQIYFADGTQAKLGNYLEYSSRTNSLVWNWNFDYPETFQPNFINVDQFTNKFTELINPDAAGQMSQGEIDALIEGPDGEPQQEIDTAPPPPIIGWNRSDTEEWFQDMYVKIWNDPLLISQMDIQNVNELAAWQGIIFDMIITGFNHTDQLSESQKVNYAPSGDVYTAFDDSEKRIYNLIQSLRSFADQNKGNNAIYLKKETRSSANINRLHAEVKITVDIFDQIQNLPEDERSIQVQQIVIGSKINDLDIIAEMYPYGQPAQHYNGNYATAVDNFVKDIPVNNWNSNKGKARLFPIPLTIEAQVKEDLKRNQFINDFIEDPVSAVKDKISSDPAAKITAGTDPTLEKVINLAIEDLGKNAKDSYDIHLDNGLTELDAASIVLREIDNTMSPTEATYFGIQDGAASAFETEFLRVAFPKYTRENATSLVNKAMSDRGYLSGDISSDVKKHLERELKSGNISSLPELNGLFDNVYEGKSIFDLGALKAQSEAFASNDALLTSTGKELLGINPFMPSGVQDELLGSGKALEQLKEAIKMSLSNNPYSGKTPTEIANEVLTNYGLTPEGKLAAFPKLYGGVLQDDGTRIFDQEIIDAEEKRRKAIGDIDPITGISKAAQMIASQTGALPPSPDESLFKQYDDPGNPGASLPAFRAIPVPVYEDQDILNVISNRYYDRPELVQFLQSQIPDIAQRFRLSQKPGSLEKESFMRGIMDPRPGIDVIIPELGQEEYGPAIDDPTSSSAAYSYFERDRPKTIADFVSSEAAQYESAFEQSPLFTQEQERLENERRYKDTQQKQRFISQPVTIFGRRRR